MAIGDSLQLINVLVITPPPHTHTDITSQTVPLEVEFLIMQQCLHEMASWSVLSLEASSVQVTVITGEGNLRRLLGSRCATVVTVKTCSSLEFQSPRQGTRWLGGWLHSCTKGTRVSCLIKAKNSKTYLFFLSCLCMHARPPACTHTSNNTGLLNPFALSPHLLLAVECQSLAGDSPPTMTLHRTMWKFFSPQALKTYLFPDETQADVLIYPILILTRKTVPRRTTYRSKVIVSH